MKKILITMILILALTASNMALASETITDIDQYKQLTFNSFDGETLELEIVGSHQVSISFNYYIPWDEVLMHEMSTYYYNIDTDVLIIMNEDGEIIYNDLEK